MLEIDTRISASYNNELIRMINIRWIDSDQEYVSEDYKETIEVGKHIQFCMGNRGYSSW